jgi:ABC-type Mn2+/Zn2+ transport system ATPase subunit
MSRPVSNFALRLEHADLGYAGEVVLRAVNLDIPKGSFFVLSGPNGGGKTTLLKSLGGFLPLLGGTLHRDGTRIGYVPQFERIDAAIPATARDLVETGAAAGKPWWRHLSSGDRSACGAYLQQCQAGSFARQLFSTLSGGQKQRVLLARALAVNPDCLLLDEPTSAIDRDTRVLILQTLSQLHRVEGRTVVMIAHDLQGLDKLASHFAVVDDGKVSVKQ